MTRRRGSGSIFRRCRTWTIQYYRGGKRIRESTGLVDFAAARQLLNIRLGAVAKGEHIELRSRKPVLVSQLWEGLKAHYREDQLKSVGVRVGATWNHVSVAWPLKT